MSELIFELKRIQSKFSETFGVTDIYTNSKVYEILIANALNHDLIPGHAGSRDGRDSEGNEYEYKHYKESSSNHTWTFNDFSETTIKRLNSVGAVVFAHINDLGEVPFINWCYIVPGKVISSYLKEKTKLITNIRKMINVSPRQIERNLNIQKTYFKVTLKGKYGDWLKRIFGLAIEIEKVVGTRDILTSNKIWEVLIALKLGHRALTKQTKYDAVDKDNNYYEYKTSKGHTWNFQDISENVLEKFKNVKKVILATVDKKNLEIVEIYEADPLKVIERLEEKLEEKRRRYEKRGGLRRLQVSLNMTDLRIIGATRLG